MTRSVARSGVVASRELRPQAGQLRLGRLRACSEALKKGSREAFLVSKTSYGFTRKSAGDAALVMISAAGEPAQIVPALKAVPPGTYVDAFTLEPFVVGQGAPVDLAPGEAATLIVAYQSMGASRHRPPDRKSVV